MALPLKFSSVAIVAAVIIAGCQKSPCELAPPSDQIGAASLMSDCLNTLEVTPVAQMPTTGQAFYNGFVTGSFDTSASTTDTLIGTARLTASFAANSTSVTGNLTNFSSGNNVATSGALTVNASTPTLPNSSILYPSNILSGNITNSTTNPLTYGGQSATFAVPVWGGYSGTSAEGIEMVTPIDATNNPTGTVSISGYTGTAGFAIVAMQ